ncbi:MAG: CPBP family intramembrane glutamic endopeptidase [Anaerolineales bacterium]
MHSPESSKKNSPWFLLWFPPVLFLLVIVVFSIYFGAQAQGDTNVITAKTAEATPYILLVVQLLLLGIQFAVFRRQGLTLRDLGWQAGEGKEAWKELLLGATIGAPMGVLWVYVMEPILSNIQSLIGDYVPVGSLFPALGAAIIPFAIADILLAPFVEENIYRGYGMMKLSPRFGVRGAIILSSLFFGLLHWSGGFWYVLTTSIIVGIPFAILRQRRGNLLVPFGAHLALNFVETLLLWLTLAQ